MYTILGLGNPGKDYEGTRHNIGRDVLLDLAKDNNADFERDSKSDALVTKLSLSGEAVRLVLPETFMNLSGKSAAYFIKSTDEAEKLLVIHDDLDLPLGTIRFSKGRGSGGHKGVLSIMNSLQTEDFVRLRIGILKNESGIIFKPKGEEAVQNFVLNRFNKKEEIDATNVKKRVMLAVLFFLKNGLGSAMNEFNK